MDRAIETELMQWKARRNRKPLLIDGARQTGKTYLLQNIFGKQFDQVLRLDFLESPNLSEAFADSLSPKDVLSNIELITSQVFNEETGLLILDEIGECPRAVTSLKYFAEKAPHMFVAASGSNIGLLESFPVGKVEQINLRPLTFREFLLASNEPALIKAYDSAINSSAGHLKLFDKLTEYYFVGGMPEAVDTWFAMANESLLERVQAIGRIHEDLITGYIRDFGKYSGKVDAGLIESIFRSVPSQLSSVVDESVNRFKFKNVHDKKSRYMELESGITWLEKCRLVLKNHPVEGSPRSPLAAYKKENAVKLFLFDVGLLNHMLGVSYKEIKQQGYEYKGYVAENFVQQELVAMGMDPTYSWHDARAEIEFILADELGKVIPIEVKSGKRTKAKSLQSYINKCSPPITIKLTGTRGSAELENKHFVYPLYYASHAVKKHVRLGWE